MNKIKTLEQKIRYRNLLLVSLITVLISITCFSLTKVFNLQAKDAVTINLAGSQRMLSQKIAYLAFRHYHNITASIVDETVTKELRDTAILFSDNQKVLSSLAISDDEQMPSEIRGLYFNEPTYLNERVNKYVKSAIKLSNTEEIGDVIIIVQGVFDKQFITDLLASLDLVVSKIEVHANQKMENMKTFELVSWLAVMVFLSAIYFYIVMPIEKLISTKQQELSRSKKQSAELTRAINKHAIVYRIDMNEKGTITEVNQRFLDFYRYTEEEIIGQSVLDISCDTYTPQFYKDIFNACITQEYWHGESINKIKGGRKLWLSSTIIPLLNNEKRIESFIVIQNDISEIKHTELTLNQLHEITSDVDSTLDEKLFNILALGKRIFNLPLALISEIHEQEYSVLYCHTPNDEISPGDAFELGNTYCCHTLVADKAISFHQAGTSHIKDHPCYQSFGLESYIGVPLVVGGERFGTLNFSGPEASSRPFTPRELELVQLFSHWISAELTRAKQQNILLAQQSLMEEMAQHARIGAWEVNLVSNTVNWSSMTKEIHEVPHDYQPELSKGIEFYKEGESRETIQKLVGDCIAHGTDFEKDLQLVTAKGNDIWVAARGRSEFVNGECIRLYGSFQDITDKMMTQQKITKHNQRMTLAADSAGMGVWELSLVTNELKWDDWMFKLYGTNDEQFSGNYEAWESFVHPEDLDRVRIHFNDAIKDRFKIDMQFRIIWPNGEIKYLKASAIAIYDSEGKPLSIIGVNYDVTALVNNETALIKAKEQAEIAAKAKNEFFASMSHEIRTPMNGVIGMLDLVKDSPLNQEQKHRIGVAQQSAKSLLSLINDILDFSKIDANKLELENVSFNLRDMIGNLAESLAQEAQNKGLELIVDLVDIEESLVVGDSNRIRQILTNLLANAIKFTKKGEVIIRLSQQSHSNTHWHIIASVTDTGIGISEDKLQSLFDVFTQVDASTTREYGGTGLGLAIVKKLCSYMQGSVNVESNEGQGSVFTCELLLEKSKDSLSAQPVLALRGKHVLIIENNQVNGDVIKRQLSRWKINAEVINSTKDALSVLNEPTDKPKYDLLLINRQLPDFNPVAFAEQVHLNQVNKNIKITCMTLMSCKDGLVNNAQSSLDGFFPKPIITSDLHLALNSMLDTMEKKHLRDTYTTKSRAITHTNLSWTDGIKLLLVEDNRVNQMVAMGVLKKIGISECVIAVNGKDALEKLKLSEGDSPFTFIFMDCQMPEMDGYEATRLIRTGAAGEHYKNITIVAMTANAMLGDKEKCLSAGMNDYLAKPINKVQVESTLKLFKK